ncbi:hypothetical protein EIP91_008284 [Steccherinum ochraceum]|uniref:F-box domain-containing protein n=1 Tax=Steccherinum ochraceum TaxID=92696 RepID=A0A4R0R326_9APHY|nr:hypothetical protein EIP91_008284 [Steccherinum ochraceum]
MYHRSSTGIVLRLRVVHAGTDFNFNLVFEVDTVKTSKFRQRVYMDLVPPELVGLIIGHLDKKSLSQCTLVCHLWNELGKSYLLESIVLQEEPAGRDFRSFFHYLQLESSVNVARYVKELTVVGSRMTPFSAHFYVHVDSQNLILTASDIDQILSWLPRLHTLSLYALSLDCASAPPQLPLKAPRHMKKLKMSLVYFTIADNSPAPQAGNSVVDTLGITSRCSLIETLNLFGTVKEFSPLKLAISRSDKRSKGRDGCLQWAAAAGCQISDAFNVEGLRLTLGEDFEILLALLRSSPRALENLKAFDQVSSDMQTHYRDIFNRVAPLLKDLSMNMVPSINCEHRPMHEHKLASSQADQLGRAQIRSNEPFTR